MNNDPARAARSEDVEGDSPERFLAALLAGCRLAFAEGTAKALHEALKHFARAALLDETRPEPHLGLGFCVLQTDKKVVGKRMA